MILKVLHPQTGVVKTKKYDSFATHYIRNGTLNVEQLVEDRTGGLWHPVASPRSDPGIT